MVLSTVVVHSYLRGTLRSCGSLIDDDTISPLGSLASNGAFVFVWFTCGSFGAFDPIGSLAYPGALSSVLVHSFLLVLSRCTGSLCLNGTLSFNGSLIVFGADRGAWFTL